MRTRVWVLLLGGAITTGCPGDKDTSAGDDSGGGTGGEETGEPCAPTDEVCDGQDNDCDGVVDNGLETLTWYPDEDGDGFGDDEAAFESCTPPDDAIAEGGDCDDSDATVQPGVPERCDGQDNDCDGRTDDADPDVEDQSTVYLDGDGDGLGVEPAFLFCEVPEGYSAELGDCDDSDSRVTTNTWYQDADGDGYGLDGEVEACEAPDGYVVNNRDCDDAEALSNPGLDEICADGIDNDCDGGSNDCVPYDGKTPVSSAGAVVDSSSSYMGMFNSAGDTDGDGALELAMASPYGGPYGTGGIFLHEGLAKGSSHVDSDATAYVYDDSSSYIGWSGTIIGDVDGDGYDDLGAYQNSRDTFWSGAGPFAAGETFSAATLASLTVSNTDTSYYGSIAGADVTGDGQSDVILGMYQATSSYSYEGVACLVPGTALVSGYAVAEVATACVWGGSSSAYAGRAVAMLGDVNGDGLREVAVAAMNASSSSSTYYTGALAVFDATASGSFNISEADFSVYGSYSYDYLGYDVAGEGDTDGDGYADILVSSSDDPFYGYNYGAAQLFYGGATLSGSVTATASDVVIYSTAGYRFGQNIGWAGDLDGDGGDDLIAGDYTDSTYGSNGGAAYLFYGPPSARVLDQADADAIIYSTTSSGLLGFGVGTVGDMDADGFDDMVVGEYGSQSAYLFFGGSL